VNVYDPRDLLYLHREVVAIEDYFGAAPAGRSDREKALRLLAGGRDYLEEYMAAARNGEAVARIPLVPRPVTPVQLGEGLSPDDPLAAHLDRTRYCQDMLIQAFVQEVLARPAVAALPPPPAGPCRTEDLARAAASGARFGTVYADPPWRYENQSSRGAAENHYATMPVEDIMALPVGALAAADAHLHLWTTNGFLQDALRVMAAWGFAFKSVFVWVKPQIGMGNYWRVSHEFLLLGTRGRGCFKDRGQPSWRVFGRTRHSAKPEAVRRLVEKVSPGPYLELFGRSPAPGWVVWGNEIGRDAFEASLGAVQNSTGLLQRGGRRGRKDVRDEGD
jgi:N6-adenosine-specific RNA methylase IME4